MYNGDSCEVLQGLPDNSIGYSCFSPPFSSLYTYSNSDRDMGNCKSDNDFYKHFKFIATELLRVIKPGRLVSIHCMLIPAMKERDGYIGLKDFRGDIIRLFQDTGFIFHGEVTIWKDPLLEAVRTKALGLMHKQLCKDSSRCRQGLPDYVVTMRKPGENKDLISHENGMITYAGSDDVKKGVYSHEVWRKYASPVWMDIRQTNTLNKNGAREEKDERHVCPLQLDTIERCLVLWSKPGDIVLSPFAGIGSEGYQAVKMDRKFIGIELKESYYKCAVKNLKIIETSATQQDLFK
ncbi:MAG: site-specific DNA-methyltransferase [Deltaproteobacteria bacterium]|nr:MAG: site-specific DNA-methyltransferase [Deltaproteobacteria bacterium]